METASLKIFGNSKHKIIMGDVIAALDEIKDSSVDLAFIDPPYNIGKDFNGCKDRWHDNRSYVNWCYKWLESVVEKITPSGSLYLMASTQSMPYFDLFLRDRVEVLSRIVWCYDSSGVQARRYYGSLYEPILFCVKDKDKYVFNAEDILIEAKTGAKRKLIDYRKHPPQVYNSEKVPGNVWSFPRVRYRMDEYENHPTQKPVALLERIIKASTNEGDVVLDPFSGTFTTSFVAKKLGRESTGVEIQEEYVKIGLRRLGLQKTYGGKRLERQVKSYERKKQEERADQRTLAV